ncbi:MAG: hypothetical protein HGA85_00350 [Nanoarchaeota archaeon]|nr:hypothetical protein [Nanoarchaeota archaeon]
MFVAYIIWFAVFISVFAISYLIMEAKIPYNMKIFANTAYYVLSSTALSLSIKGILERYVNLQMLQLLALVAYVCITSCLAGKVNRYFPIPKRVIDKKESPYFFNFNRPFIITKISDIIFQQMMIMWLIALLSADGLTSFWLIGVFALVFSVFHIPSIIKHKRYAMYFIGLSLVGGILMPFLIINFKSGILYSFALHYTSYFAGRIGFSIYYSLRYKPQVQQSLV